MRARRKRALKTWPFSTTTVGTPFRTWARRGTSRSSNRDGNIDDDEGCDHQERMRERVILPHQCPRSGAADDEEQNEVEYRQLAKRAPAGRSDYEPEDEIDHE